MRTILIIISFFVSLNIYSQESNRDFTYSLRNYIKSRPLYRDTDSLQQYFFKILLNNKKEIRNFTTFYISPQSEVISFSDSTSFRNFKFEDIEGTPPVKLFNTNTGYFLQPFILKKVEYVVNPAKDFHFSSNDISNAFKLLSKISSTEMGKPYILKPIIIFQENPVQ